MKIRFLIANAYGVGGTIRTTFNTASALAERHVVEIVSVLQRRDEPALALDPRVHLRTLTDMRPHERPRREEWAARRPSRVIDSGDYRYKGFNALSDVELLRFLASVRDGVIVATRPGLNLALARFGRRSVVRVGQDHMNLASYKPALRPVIARTYRRLDLVTALTESSAEEYRALLGPGTRVECVPNGVPAVGDLDATPGAKLVVAAGRLVGRKGFDRLLRAWAQVAPEFPDWRLAIFGSGPSERGLLALVDALGVAGSVRLAGYTPRMSEELASGSLFALTSRREGFPMVILEAMSVGLPVVAYDCPTGPRDIVTSGVDGYVVRDGATEELAAALGELMGSEAKRRAFGAAAREKAAAYGIATTAARWEELFDELAAWKDRNGVSPRLARRS